MGRDLIKDFKWRSNTIWLDQSLATTVEQIYEAASFFKKGVILDFGGTVIKIAKLKPGAFDDATSVSCEAVPGGITRARPPEHRVPGRRSTTEYPRPGPGRQHAIEGIAVTANQQARRQRMVERHRQRNEAELRDDRRKRSCK